MTSYRIGRIYKKNSLVTYFLILFWFSLKLFYINDVTKIYHLVFMENPMHPFIYCLCVIIRKSFVPFVRRRTFLTFLKCIQTSFPIKYPTVKIYNAIKQLINALQKLALRATTHHNSLAEHATLKQWLSSANSYRSTRNDIKSASKFMGPLSVHRNCGVCAQVHCTHLRWAIVAQIRWYTPLRTTLSIAELFTVSIMCTGRR